ncbi:hypothetical protein F5X96DRAFT_666128 [Biscogniauxia mediterranea]|nr:hypothetical protein F5X96DRAFT_666128 [Biscogniauxia mediterranea]
MAPHHTATIHDLRAWACGHTTSVADASSFALYNVPASSRQHITPSPRRCPDCRQAPFHARLRALESTAARHAAEIAESASRLRRRIAGVTRRHRGHTREYVDARRTPQQGGGGGWGAAELTWLALEGTLVAGRRAEIDDVEGEARGLRRRLAFLRDVAGLMGGIARRPGGWVAEGEDVEEGERRMPRVERLCDELAEYAEHVRGWVEGQIAERAAELDGCEAEVVDLREMWRVQQDVGGELLVHGSARWGHPGPPPPDGDEERGAAGRGR